MSAVKEENTENLTGQSLLEADWNWGNWDLELTIEDGIWNQELIIETWLCWQNKSFLMRLDWLTGLWNQELTIQPQVWVNMNQEFILWGWNLTDWEIE